MIEPLCVRLHDDVAVGPVLVRSGRVLRLSPTAQSMLADRVVVADSRPTVALAHRLIDLDLARPVRNDHAVADVSDLTVVVPVKDRPAEVGRLLAELSGRVECIVVDDASGDPEALRVVADPHRARLLRLEENLGPAGARNAGLAQVSSRFVAFVDSDINLSTSDLVRLLEEFVDPDLAVVAPRVRTRGGERWFERYEDGCGALDLGARSATVRPWSAVAYVPSACLVARVDALGDGFDESLISGEDVDLVWRLIAAGGRVRYCADVQVWHDHRSTARGWLGRKFFYGTSAAALARRHGSKVAPAVLSAESAALVAAVVVQRRWATVVAAGLGLRSYRVVSAQLPELDRNERARLTGASASATARQASALALRHWWPMAAVLMVFSRRARKAVIGAAVIDFLVSRKRSSTALGPARFLAARRVDDLAYGAGVWWGAFRARSIRCLLPARSSGVGSGQGGGS
ncbi:mycofactocin biosynthesis glycosyltransferase MftF [Aeromicrobium sp. CF3.5]|uniref:mycofactocin biosynthesis glycosyltransferase MftF n=1 Tax=Aeromicrobium sp. CF3.5 TaxID=3373078 RepID=UPI003EE79623